MTVKVNSHMSWCNVMDKLPNTENIIGKFEEDVIVLSHTKSDLVCYYMRTPPEGMRIGIYLTKIYANFNDCIKKNRLNGG